jgi:hypothetical protein
MLCCYVTASWCSEGTTFIQNITNHPPNDAVLCCKRPKSCTVLCLVSADILEKYTASVFKKEGRKTIYLKYASIYQIKAQHHSPKDRNMNKRHCLLQSCFVTVLPIWYKMILFSSQTMLKDNEE